VSSPPTIPASYSTAELARRLGVSVPTVQRWVDSGHLKAWKTVGGHRRIEAESAEEMIRSQEKPADAGAGPGRPLSVMVVDDNVDDRELLAALVEAALPDAAVTAAENGFEALVAIGQATPDVLITDVVMPHMNGVEMLKHLRAESLVRPRVLLAVSSQAPKEIAALGELPPDVSFIGKPIDPDIFIATLRRAVLGS
jgi:excisionase family DNA binding protein